MEKTSSYNLTAVDIIPTIETGLSNVGFLFGAGTSYEAGFPLTMDLTKFVIDNLGDENKKYIEITLETENKNFGKSYSITDNLPDIELILNFILKHKLGQTGTTLEKYIALEKEIKKLIVDKLISVRTPNLTKHIELLSIIKSRYNRRAEPFWIFTTNYDMLFEQASMYSEIPVKNGFEGIDARYFDICKMDLRLGRINTKRGIPQFEMYKEPYMNLVKLHGSISWYQKQGKFFEIFNKNYLDEEFSRVMIHPQNFKVSQTLEPPYDNLFTYAQSVLGANCKYLVTCGYSFRDKHINDRLIIPKLKEGKLRVCALFPTVPSNIEEFSQYSGFNYITDKEIFIDGKTYTFENELWKFSELVNFLKS